MKKLYKILSRTTNIICQLILIFGCIWVLKGNSLIPSFPRPYASMKMDSEKYSPASADSAPRMMKSAPEMGGGGSLMSDVQASEVKPQAKIIKTGNVSFEVQDLNVARKTIVALLPEFKAYILNESEGKDTQNQYATLNLKVPADKFDALVEKVIQTGYTIENKSINLSDVTEQYIDLDSRLKNKRILKEKYTTLLTQAKKMEDVININRQLELVSSELESLEGQMKYLSHQIDLSSLDVNLIKRLVPTEKNKSFLTDLSYELNSGLNAFRSAVLFILGLWPFMIIAVVGFFIYKKVKRK
jgi:hypothetical protein